MKGTVVNTKSNDPPQPEEKVPGLGITILREIIASKAALVAVFIYVGFVILAFILSAQLDLAEMSRIHLRYINRPPEWFGGQFFLGADHMGRDMVAQLMLGARTSFGVAFSVTAIGLIVGTLFGLISGFYGGHTDNIMMRILDFVMMLPTLPIIIIVVSLIPHYQVWHFVLVVSAFAWMGTARLIRAAVLRQSALDYVAASKTLGTRNVTIIFKKVFPNITSILVTNSIISLGANMGLETGLTIVGFGLPFGTPSLGGQIASAMDPRILTGLQWQWMPAAILIFIMVLCTYIVGTAISRAVDPKQQRQI